MTFGPWGRLAASKKRRDLPEGAPFFFLPAPPCDTAFHPLVPDKESRHKGLQPSFCAQKKALFIGIVEHLRRRRAGISCRMRRGCSNGTEL
jgi:hypothetical protein